MITLSLQNYLPTAETLHKEMKQLDESSGGLRINAQKLALEGTTDDQIQMISHLVSYTQYKKITRARRGLLLHLSMVQKGEQPFANVWDMVARVRRHRKIFY